MFSFSSSLDSLRRRCVGRYFLTALCLFVFALPLMFGKEQTYVSAPLVGSSIASPNSVGVFDQTYLLNPSSIEGYNWLKNSVVFEFDKADIKKVTVAKFTLKLKVNVELWDLGSSLTSPASRSFMDELTLTYDPLSTNISDLRSVKNYEGAVKIVVKVSNLTCTPAIALSTLPRYQLFCDVQVSRQLVFSTGTALSSVLGSVNVADNRLNFAWSSLTTILVNNVPTLVASNADEYDIEWNFYESQSTILSLTAAQQLETFRFNASRMSVSGTTAWIPNLYRDGHVLYRVRPARYLADGSRQTSIWTVPKRLTISITQSHERNLNWQCDISFAEDGKKGSTIKYVDGTLRERQSVSYSVANKTTYATQTIYDSAGRAAVRTMPLPTQTEVIKYIDNLAVSSQTNTAYQPVDFQQSGDCGFQPKAMSTTSSIASRYYAANNTSTVLGVFKKPLIPNAEGYHFTVTQFTPDQTGRIKRHSGVGSTFRMGGGKETEYFYGKPSQEELDRLFGTEVGYASHYQKNMVMDPNKQVAVSYVDAHGRTIATAMAGASPTTLDSLQGSTVKEKITNNILNNVRQGDSLVSTYALLVTNPSTAINVLYGKADTQYSSACLPSRICYDCQYEVTIRVTDNCQNAFNPLPRQANKPYIWQKTTVVTGAILYDTLCRRTSHQLDSFQLTLPIGEYRVSKTLRVHRAAVDYYADHYMKRSTCLPDSAKIVNTMKGAVDSTNCSMTCESCKAGLGTEAVYISKYFAGLDAPIVRTSSDTIGARMAYLRLLDDCNRMCQDADECQSLYEVMLMDVSPGGQYALFDSTYNWRKDSTSIFSKRRGSIIGTVLTRVRVGGRIILVPLPIYDSLYRYQTLDTNCIYMDALNKRDSVLINGVLYAPRQLTPQQFYENWKPSWAKALVKLHPEYCAYESCKRTQQCNGFDDKILAINTYSAALTAKVIDTLGTFLGDSCFISGLGLPYKDSIRLWLSSNMTDPNNCTNYSGINFVVNSVYGPGGTFGQGTSADNDQAWLLLRGLYISYKSQLKSRWRAAACRNSLADCVGTTLATCGGVNNMYKDKIRRAINISYLDSTVTVEKLKAQADSARVAIINSCNESCKENADVWMQQLASCFKTAADSAKRPDIRSRLIAVCQLGCDENHPFGASSTKGSLATTYGDTSFTQVIDRALGTRSNSCDSCHGNVITYPGPYFASVYMGARPIKKKEDAPCLYTNLTALKSCFTASTTAPFSSAAFSKWLLKYSELPLSKNELDTLEKYFNPSNPSNYLPMVINLPPYLECNVCKTYAEVQAVKNLFTCTNAPASIEYWEKFARFANNKLGFILNAEEYYTFLNPTVPPPAACNSQRLLCPRSPYGYDEPMDSCNAGLTAQVLIQADLSYQAKLDSTRRAFETNYIKHCLDAADTTEKLLLKMDINEYHYTLYYYDQAGNLIKTVPPKGVTLFPQRKTLSDSIAASRKSSNLTTLDITPNHTYKTQYVFNSLNQTVKQKSPDAEESLFWYDRIGRLVVSQDGRQAQKIQVATTPVAKYEFKYSYTVYDALGRVNQVGEVTKPTTGLIDNTTARDPYSLSVWLNTTRKEFITETFYDEPKFDLSRPLSIKGQMNLRNRVVSSITRRYFSTMDTMYQFASHFSYDVVGNVRNLVQEIRELHVMNQGFKKLDYDYDQLSGKVNSVVYQSGQADQFAHRYIYDEDNKLVTTYTTTRVAAFTKAMPQPTWQYRREADYDYFQHGPLARTEIGDRRVQGMDYAYTLQGWLKGINSDSLKTSYDIGKDGDDVASNPRKYVGRDAMGFSIGYFTGDFKTIGGSNVLLEQETASNFYTTTKNLYNGNIRQMRVAIQKLTGGSSIGYAYGYDQLNRISKMDVWNKAKSSYGSSTNDYQERVSYDANGNILRYARRNGTGKLMDSLTYKYAVGKNQLLQVSDSVRMSPETDDIENQSSSNNYVYDPSGNMIRDLSDTVTVNWSPYGKITDVVKGILNSSNLKYGYDPMQNRVLKVSGTGTSEVKTYYFRDAQGNVLATYQRKRDSLWSKEQDIYGSSRLGVTETNQLMYPSVVGDTLYKIRDQEGSRRYELANHLGNVLAVVSDRKLGIGQAGAGNVDYASYEAVTITATDYFPFGMSMQERTYSAPNTEGYRYSFNGQENDKELGNNILTAEFWEYDARIGRRWNLDPKPDIQISDYACLDNNPIQHADPNGKNPIAGLIGAVAGGVIGGGIEAGVQLWRDGKVSNWSAVGGSAAQGAITGGVAGLTMGVSLVGTVAAAGVANGVGGAINKTIQGKSNEITAGSVASDVATGAAFAVAGHVLGKVTKIGLDKLSNASKGKIGEAVTKIKYAAKGYKSEGNAVVRTGRNTRVRMQPERAEYDHAMKNVFSGKQLTVESKFNTSQLNIRQRLASSNVTTPGGLIVDRTTSQQLGNTVKAVVTGTSGQRKK